MKKTIRSVVLADEVLDDIMHFFWRNGLADTSIEDLVLLTGLNRAAIYKYFKGKDGLFLAMLERYRERVIPQFIAPLQRKNSDISGIVDFFTQFLTYCQTENATDGCFIIATAADIHLHKQPVVHFITTFLSLLRQLFYDNLSSAHLNKQIPQQLNCSAMADFLVGNVFGFWTLLRAKAPRNLIINHLQEVLNYLAACKSN